MSQLVQAVPASGSASVSEWLQRFQQLSGDELQAAMTAAVKTCAARSEASGMETDLVRPEAVNATEVVVVASALIRAADLNLFDVAMWFRRPAMSGFGPVAQAGAGRG